MPVVALTPPDADLAHHGLVPPDAAAARRRTLAEVRWSVGFTWLYWLNRRRLISGDTKREATDEKQS